MDKQSSRVVVITGGAQGIGKALVEHFQNEGDQVSYIDIQDNQEYQGDLSQPEVIEAYAEYIIEKFGRVDVLINNAIPLMKGIDQCSYQDFQYAMSVGVTAPFYLSKLLAPHFVKGGSIINVSSTRSRMSQPQTESYTAAKGGLSALTHALAVSLAGKVRVNSVSLGWIDTTGQTWMGPDAYQQPVGRVGRPEDVVRAIDFLISPQASFINGTDLCIDGGMTKQMIYHNDWGWTLARDGE